MMHIATLRTVGGSTMVAIPKALLEALGLAADTKVALRIDQGRLVIEPQPKPKYSLDELLAKCDATAPASNEDGLWEAANPVDREVI
jgi:antitoxin ChpS